MAHSTLVGVFNRIRFYVSFKELTPADQTSSFLDLDIEMVEMKLRLPLDKLVKLMAPLASFISCRKGA